LLVLGGLLMVSSAVTASRADGSIRDEVYVSPTWGYTVHWYGDEWSVATESSQDGADALWLRDADGSLLGFEGYPGYAGDARACLDDVMTRVADVAGGEGTLLFDEWDRPQKIFHPWRSWIGLLVEKDPNDPSADSVVYLDCRTLVPEQAVFVRYLVVPVAAFPNDGDLSHFDPLNAALPRGAWAGDSYSGLHAAGLRDNTAEPPFPVDTIVPWEFPGQPQLLAPDEFGPELAMFTIVDGDLQNRVYVVMIENTGTDSFTVDPALFSDSNDPREPRPDSDIPPSRVSWDDGTASGPRTLEPGARASLTLEFPPLPVERSQASFLVYWDSQAEGGALMLECIESCGFGAVGSLPELRLGR
jgi:hypothetical protein